MGMISKIYSWGQQGAADDNLNTLDWFAALVLILILSFLWTRVISQIL